MKIVRIRFQNLNSLEGEWQINFDHPAYQTNNIFAITGPTGSGKTTLLDAICLALYGRTPRLKTISKSSNEILTRQTGICFSEVTFITLKGQYRCHWSQHRARKNPDGDLQQPRHEIVEADTDTILENKIKNVARVVEDVTGMNFDQFTRSILLAQGSFAAFLLAPSDERAPVLEQITGTEVYSRISMKVHERTAEENKRYKTLAEDIAKTAILTKEEEEKLQRALMEKRSQTEDFQAQLAHIRTSLTWLDTMHSLTSEIDVHKKELERLKTQLHQEEGNKQQLQRAKSAWHIEPQYRHLISLRNTQAHDVKDLGTKEQHRQSLTVAVAKLLPKIGELEKDVAIAQQEIEVGKELANNVRALDIRLQESTTRLKEIERSATVQGKEKADLEQKRISLIGQIEEKNSALQECGKYLSAHETDVNLIENLAALQEKFDQIHNRSVAHDTLIIEAQAAEAKLGKRSEDALQYHNKHNAIAQTHKNALAKLQDGVDSIASLNTRYPHLREDMAALADSIRRFEILQATLEQKQSLVADRKKLFATRQTLKDSLQHDESEKLRHSEKLVSQQEAVRKQEEIVLLSARIKSYEKERLHLRSGEPCPLCGALEHPFGSKAPDADDDVKKVLIAEKELLEKLQQQAIVLQTSINVGSSRLKEAEKSLVECDRQIGDTQIAVQKMFDSLALTEETVSLESVATQLDEYKKKNQLLQETAAKKDHLETTVLELRQTVDEHLKNLTHHEKTLQRVKSEITVLEEKNRALQRQKKEVQYDISQLMSELTAAITPYGFNDVEQHNYQTILENLSARQVRWKKQKETEQKLLEDVRGAKTQQENLLVMQDKISNNNRIQKEEIGRKQEQIKNIQDKRHTLYGDKKPDEEEKQLHQSYTGAVDLLKKRESEKIEYNKDLAVVTEQIDALRQAIDNRKEQLDNEELQFSHMLTSHGFTSEKEFHEDMLSEEQIAAIEAHLKDLEEQHKRIETLIAEKTQQCHSEKQKDLTQQSPEELNEELSLKNQALEENLQKAGKLQAQLEENIVLISNHKQKRKTLAAQKKELLRWQKLDNLIGSANGKKFRNFAQGITFDIMVQHANNNLRKMTDRYILVRDTLHPLELNVIDNYQAGVVRTTKNLSGGESFLVSLALALGLSNMASRNVRVDSLFLDEGFGTLDEETLETAMQTLAGLQQEGKIIGIISHISLLQDRLDTKIQVTAGPGGRSKLAGPGVQAM